MPLRTVRILCFGDSLTEGYTQCGNMFHPYAHNMMKRLRVAFPEVKLDISVKGRSSDEVMPPSGKFKERLDVIWKDAKDRGEPFHWVIILGGTNDLAIPSMKPEELFQHLEELYETCFAHGAKVIAMTIPERGAVLKWLDDNRDAANEMIRNYSRDNYFVFDLHQEMPFFKLSHRERDAFWDDGLHLTTLGYSKMGNKVADFFHPLLKAHIDAMPRDPPSPVSPRSNPPNGLVRRRSCAHGSGTQTKSETPAANGPVAAIAETAAGAAPQAARGDSNGVAKNVNAKGKDAEVDEERGDPSVLSQGYIYMPPGKNSKLDNQQKEEEENEEETSVPTSASNSTTAAAATNSTAAPAPVPVPASPTVAG